jgi:hypothetical protein
VPVHWNVMLSLESSWAISRCRDCKVWDVVQVEMSPRGLGIGGKGSGFDFECLLTVTRIFEAIMVNWELLPPDPERGQGGAKQASSQTVRREGSHGSDRCDHIHSAYRMGQALTRSWVAASFKVRDLVPVPVLARRGRWRQSGFPKQRRE